MRSLVVTPTYNESENLAAFVKELFAHADVDLLIVDDNSPDGTGQIADSIAAADKRVRVMHRPGKMGLGTAYKSAFQQALGEGYDYIFEMDADLSHDPKFLPLFFHAFRDGADVVVGSRNIAGGRVVGWGPLRHIISKGGSLYSRTILGVQVRDLTSGYKGFRAETLKKLDLPRVTSEGYSFQIELTYRALQTNCRVVEVPITFVDRKAGHSKMSRRIFAEAVHKVWRIRFGSK